MSSLVLRTPGRAGRKPTVLAAIAFTITLAVATLALRSADAAPEASPQPSAPITAAFFYPWFPNAWDQGVFPFTNYTPTLGWYDSADPNTIDAQLDLASRAGLDAFIASWWGPGHHTDKAMPALLDTTVRQGSSAPALRWTVYYEEEGQSDPSPARIVEDLRYLKSNYFDHPGFLRVDGKPVVFVWADPGDGASMADRWARAKADFGGEIHVVLKVFSGYRDVASQPDSWHQYGPASPYEEHLPHSAAVSPGFWLKGQGPRLDRDLARFKADAQRVKDSGAFWQLVTSWNEWGEGTAVEPATEYGTAYIDALGEVFGGSTADEPPPLIVTTSSSPTTETTASPTTETTSSPTTETTASPTTETTASPTTETTSSPTTETTSSPTSAVEATSSTEPEPPPTSESVAVPDGPAVTVTVDADAGGSIQEGSYRRRYRDIRQRTIRVDARPRIDGLVKFEVPPDFHPTQATLRLHPGRDSDEGIEVHAVADTTWFENRRMPRVVPEFGELLARSGEIDDDEPVDLDVTAAVQGEGPVSFGLRTTSNRRIWVRGPRSSRPPELILVGHVSAPSDEEDPLVVDVTQPQDPATSTPTDPASTETTAGDSSTVTTAPATSQTTTSSIPVATSTTAGSGNATTTTTTSTTSTTTTSTTTASTTTRPPAPTGDTVTFGAAGDFGGKDSRAGTVMTDMKNRNLAAFFLLGDMSYSEIEPESAWCDWVHSYLGSNYPFEIVAGNHEEDSRVDGHILNFAECMPDRLGSELGPGGYSVNYASDLGPVTVVSVSPDLVVGGVDYRYRAGSAERTWMLAAISRAKAEGDWVIVGMHKNCITIGTKSCEIGEDFVQLLVDHKVDLILQGHEHSYGRTHSLSRVVENGVGTIADNGSDGRYAKGAGTVTVITGTAGRSMRNCSHSDSEYGNFAFHWCGEEATDTKGYLLLTASPSSLTGRFVTTTGTPFNDSFRID